MEGCRGVRIIGRRRGEGESIDFKSQVCNSLFCSFFCCFFFLQKMEKLEENTKIKALQNFNGENVVASLKKGGGGSYMWFFKKKPECFLDFIFTTV